MSSITGHSSLILFWHPRRIWAKKPQFADAGKMIEEYNVAGQVGRANDLDKLRTDDGQRLCRCMIAPAIGWVVLAAVRLGLIFSDRETDRLAGIRQFGSRL